jgi:hypothetical protein
MFCANTGLHMHPVSTTFGPTQCNLSAEADLGCNTMRCTSSATDPLTNELTYQDVLRFALKVATL